MKVRELMEILSGYDPDMDVLTYEFEEPAATLCEDVTCCGVHYDLVVTLG